VNPGKELGGGSAEEGHQMTELFVNAFFAVRGFHSYMFERARTERGASMVEYALLVGLIAIVAVVAVMALGGGIKSLFGSANSCVGGINSGATTNC
jgi:pilus assembly protein Flp/PilA